MNQIKVSVKIKPVEDDAIEILADGVCRVEKVSYIFDSVSPGTLSNQEFFAKNIEQQLQQLLEGYNVCVLCYGFTGSGKTYTMFGTQQESGIAFLAVENLIGAVTLTSMTLRVVEVYLDKVYDLISGDNTAVRVTGEGLQGATHLEINTVLQFRRVLSKAVGYRQSGSTAANSTSSRSHCVAIVTVRCRNPDTQQESEGELYLVDLAGCERLDERSIGDTVTLRESQSINRSVFAINNVVMACSQGKSFVPYRNSKITRILRNAFGGNSLTQVIVCCDGSKPTDSTNSLRFGARCKLINNDALANIEEEDPRDIMIMELREQIEDLQRQLAAIGCPREAAGTPNAQADDTPRTRESWNRGRSSELQDIRGAINSMKCLEERPPAPPVVAVGKEYCC